MREGRLCFFSSLSFFPFFLSISSSVNKRFVGQVTVTHLARPSAPMVRATGSVYPERFLSWWSRSNDSPTAVTWRTWRFFSNGRWPRQTGKQRCKTNREIMIRTGKSVICVIIPVGKKENYLTLKNPTWLPPTSHVTKRLNPSVCFRIYIPRNRMEMGIDLLLGW